jgi:hypothetical protein
MKKLTILLALSFAVLQSYAQEAPLLAKIQYGETLFVNGYVIEFEKVISDSRCPDGVTCIRAGEANILVNIYKSEELIESKELFFYPSSVVNKMKPILFKGENILINALNLSPYPEVHHRIPERMYCLDIAIY